jgi:hypothetical protein
MTATALCARLADLALLTLIPGGEKLRPCRRVAPIGAAPASALN